MVKYCSSCWRNEHHVVLKPNAIAYGMLLVGTCGLAWFFRPKKCVCCGRVRIL